MYTFSVILASFLYFLPLITSTPTPKLSKRCGTYLEPALSQLINEALPSTVYPNTANAGNPVQVYQNVTTTSNGVVLTDRIYQAIGFANVPDTAYGCTLSVRIPPTGTGEPFKIIPPNGPPPRLDIYTFGTAASSDTGLAGSLNWNALASYNHPPPELFGTVTVWDGTHQTINSAVCPFVVSNGTSNTIAFTVRISAGVDEEAGISWNWSSPSPPGPTGFYLSYDC